jgi:hypothetical protein
MAARGEVHTWRGLATELLEVITEEGLDTG